MTGCSVSLPRNHLGVIAFRLVSLRRRWTRHKLSADCSAVAGYDCGICLSEARPSRGAPVFTERRWPGSYWSPYWLRPDLVNHCLPHNVSMCLCVCGCVWSGRVHIIQLEILRPHVVKQRHVFLLFASHVTGLRPTCRNAGPST